MIEGLPTVPAVESAVVRRIGREFRARELAFHITTDDHVVVDGVRVPLAKFEIDFPGAVGFVVDLLEARRRWPFDARMIGKPGYEFDRSGRPISDHAG